MFDWYEEESESEEISVFEQRQKGKARKRKWREIETIKETRRLKRELSELNVHPCF
ncbi:MAG: DUF3545 family protein [Colwellia sp.]|nr:DUF3545 family protein [Colwellia sp.]